MTPAVRQAVDADRAALVDLWIEAWQAAMPRIDFTARRDWITQHLETLEAAGATLLVAWAGARPTGFVTIEPDGTVDQLVVAVPHQGQGVAAILLAAARKYAPAVLRLTVNTDNARAVRFYRRQGFRVLGHGFNVTSGLPVLHMRWEPERDDER